MSERESRTERSFCRICTSLCGTLVDVEGDKVVGVRGDRDHPVTHGYLCPKGRALPRMHHDPRRLERPLLRTDGVLLVHPTDAAEAGVTDGQPVTVRTAKGELVGTARVDARMRPGVVSVPHGHEHANVNYLTSIREVDPLTGMARYSGIPVSVHPVPPRPLPALEWHLARFIIGGLREMANDL